MAVSQLLLPAIGRGDIAEDELDEPCIGVGVAPPMPDIELMLELESFVGRKLVLGRIIEFPAWYCIKASVSYFNK